MRPHGSSQPIACHDCDAVFQAPDVQEGERVGCPRCGASLFSRRRNPLHRATALTAAAAILFALANFFPFLRLKASYRESDMILAQSVTGLEHAGYPRPFFKEQRENFLLTREIRASGKRGTPSNESRSGIKPPYAPAEFS